MNVQQGRCCAVPGPLHASHPMFGVKLGVIPFDRSYWVVPGRLLAGVYPASDQPHEATEKLRRLLSVGVRHLVNLTEPTETNWRGVPLLDYEPELTVLAGQQNAVVLCSRLPIRDLDVPSVATMKAILDDIDRAVAARRTVYVHCWGGRGRTGTVVGCYLARHGLAVGDRALRRTPSRQKRRLRRNSCESGQSASEQRRTLW